METKYQFIVPSDEIARRKAPNFHTLIERRVFERGVPEYLETIYDGLHDTDAFGQLVSYKSDFDRIEGTGRRHGEAFLDGAMIVLDVVNTYQPRIMPLLPERLIIFRSELMLEHLSSETDDEAGETAYLQALRRESRLHLRSLTRDYFKILDDVAYVRGYRNNTAAAHLQEGCGFMLEMASWAYRSDEESFIEAVKKDVGEPVTLMSEIGRFLKRERERRAGAA